MNSKDTIKTTNIVLLRFNNREMEDDCISQVLKCTDPAVTPYHLTVYDNFPSRGGVAEGWNKAINAFVSDYVCLLNTDTIVEDKWLEKLLQGFSEGVGAVGPITNKCGTHQTGFSKSEKNDNKVNCKTLSGFCLLFRRKLWEEEPFNEEYQMYAEETEFLDHAIKRGWKLLTDYSVHIFHYGGASAKKADKEGYINLKDIKTKSKKLYEKRR